MCRTALRAGLAPTFFFPDRHMPTFAHLALTTMLSLAGVAAAQTVPRPDAQLNGETRDDGFGSAIEAAGDVNDDGFIDYIASAPGDDDVAEGSGEVYIFYGPLTRDRQAGSADASITGEEIVDDFGSDVASAGDVNGDGVDDIVIGARSTDTAGIQAGRAYVFYGPVAGSHSALDADAIISGDDFNELGWSVAPAGDVNGDGFDDILVGAWMADLRGQAHLFLGPVEGQLNVADAAATVSGVLFSEELGYDVAAGDLNDDGVPDLILGAPRPPLNGNGTGRAYVFFGPVTGSMPATDADAIIVGDGLNDELGTSVAAGDLNDDGAADLVVGAHQLFVQNAQGKAYVFYGPLRGVISAATADAVLVGEDFPTENGLFGESVAVLGDSDGDGVGDLLVGAPFAEAGAIRTGRAYVFHGPLFGTIPAAGADRIITGSEFDLLGSVVAAAGDNDGDGLADALVGAPQFFGENGIGFAGLYAGQGVAPSGLEIAVTPIDPPVVIPASGGTVRLRIAVVNNAAVAVGFDLWTELERPDGRVRTSSPLHLTLDAGATLTRTVQRRISADAPPGGYTLRGLVGAFPIADDVDAFTFVKE
jgi:hypothetical protein